MSTSLSDLPLPQGQPDLSGQQQFDLIIVVGKRYLNNQNSYS